MKMDHHKLFVILIISAYAGIFSNMVSVSFEEHVQGALNSQETLFLLAPFVEEPVKLVFALLLLLVLSALFGKPSLAGASYTGLSVGFGFGLLESFYAYNNLGFKTLFFRLLTSNPCHIVWAGTLTIVTLHFFGEKWGKAKILGWLVYVSLLHLLFNLSMIYPYPHVVFVGLLSEAASAYLFLRTYKRLEKGESI